MTTLVANVVSIVTDIMTWFSPRPGRDVRISGGARHEIRGAGEPQVVQIRPAAIDGGGMVSASVTVAYADPGQASQA